MTEESLSLPLILRNTNNYCRSYQALLFQP